MHYVRWELTADEVAAVERGPVRLSVDHVAYGATTGLDRRCVAELVTDLRD